MKKINMAEPRIDLDVEEIIGELRLVLESGQYIKGPVVEELERRFARHVGAKYGVACCNGSIALLLALEAHGINNKWDFILTTPFSFIATATAITRSGATPFFCDIDPETYNICPKSVAYYKEQLGGLVKAVLPVHLYGKPADLDAIRQAVGDDVVIIEDACQSHGAVYKKMPIGSHNTACWSFFPTKNMTVVGDGGMVTTNCPEVDKKLRLIRDHGQVVRYRHDEHGFNFRMSEIHAAIGLCQLQKLSEMNLCRIKNAELYNEILDDLQGIVLPAPNEKDCEQVFHQYTIRVTDKCKVERDKLREELAKIGIATGVHYPIPIHKQPIYAQNSLYSNNKRPVAEQAAREVLSLPVHPSLTADEVIYIAEQVRRICLEY